MKSWKRCWNAVPTCSHSTTSLVLHLSRSGIPFRLCFFWSRYRQPKHCQTLTRSMLYGILLNTFCRYKRLFGTPTVFSVMCSMWEMRPIRGWFPAKLHGSTNKNSHFLGRQEVTSFVWYSVIVADNLWYLNKWRLFWCPLFDCPPNIWSGSATAVTLGTAR